MGHAVKKSRCTEEQIAFALKQAETGIKIDEICLERPSEPQLV